MIKHVKGDIFESDADIIIHQVNCQGVMGAGVAKQVKDKYPNVYSFYRRICESQTSQELLGKVLLVNTLEYIDNGKRTRMIANFFSQDNYRNTYSTSNKVFTDYNAFRECLECMRDDFGNYSMAIPYLIGCCRGGGNWNRIYRMIEEILGDCDVTIYEYDLR